MTVTLARRLVWEGVVTPEDVNVALATHVRDRVPFLRALVQRAPQLLSRLEGELGQARTTMPPPILPDETLVAALPPGLVEALLAVPVSKDPETSVVRVMVADGADPHVKTELSYHLGAPVELVAAPLRILLEAVRPRSSPPSPRGSFRTPLFGVKAIERPPSSVPVRADVAPSAPMQEVRSSEPPIPLVRVSSDVPAPQTVKGVAPQAAGASYASGVVVPKRAATPTAEPIIQLTRTKSLAPSPPSAPDSSPPATLAGQPAPSPRPSGPESLEGPLRELSEATNAEDVVAILARGLGAVSRRALVLAVRGKVFEGRESNDPSIRDSVRVLVVSADRPSVLLTASQTGQYLGPMPQTLVHQELYRLLGEPQGDIGVGSVTVSGRAALLWVTAGMDAAYLTTRRGAALGEAAGKALERIVRERKK